LGKSLQRQLIFAANSVKIKLTLKKNKMGLQRFLQPLPLFIIAALVIALPLFLFPINLFKGEIILKMPINAMPIQAKLSLSYFVGMGYAENEMENVKEFYLTAEGYFFAAVLIIGFPGLLAYRVSLTKH
jgi:hypothetical protein